MIPAEPIGVPTGNTVSARKVADSIEAPREHSLANALCQPAAGDVSPVPVVPQAESPAVDAAAQLACADAYTDRSRKRIPIRRSLPAQATRHLDPQAVR